MEGGALSANVHAGYVRGQLSKTDLLTRVQGRKENEWRGELAKLLDISTLRM
jgi:hypothetical protein